MRRLLLGCLVLLAASPAFGYLVDLRAVGADPECVHLVVPGGPTAFQIQMYIDTQSSLIVCTAGEARIATVHDSSSSIPVPDVLDITLPNAIPITSKTGQVTDVIYPQYNAPIWKQKQSELALPLPQGRMNQDTGLNASSSRIGTQVNLYNGYGYIYGRVLMATFTVQLKQGYNGPMSNDCQHPSFYVVASDAFVYNNGTLVANPGQKIGVCVTPEPATALLLLAAVPFLRRRR